MLQRMVGLVVGVALFTIGSAAVGLVFTLVAWLFGFATIT